MVKRLLMGLNKAKIMEGLECCSKRKDGDGCDTCPYYKDVAFGVCGCMINYPMDMEVPDDETL